MHADEEPVSAEYQGIREAISVQAQWVCERFQDYPSGGASDVGMSELPRRPKLPRLDRSPISESKLRNTIIDVAVYRAFEIELLEMQPSVGDTDIFTGNEPLPVPDEDIGVDGEGIHFESAKVAIVEVMPNLLYKCITKLRCAAAR